MIEKKIKNLPVKVLAEHGVVERDGDVVRLLTDELSHDERVRIRTACEQRLRDYMRRKNHGDDARA